jgi:hypothetical protein
MPMSSLPPVKGNSDFQYNPAKQSSKEIGSSSKAEALAERKFREEPPKPSSSSSANFSGRNFSSSSSSSAAACSSLNVAKPPKKGGKRKATYQAPPAVLFPPQSRSSSALVGDEPPTESHFYSGGLRGDLRHGKGVLKWPGGKYEGDFVDGLREGQGVEYGIKWYKVDGQWIAVETIVYQGGWKQDKYHVQGAMVPRETILKGEFIERYEPVGRLNFPGSHITLYCGGFLEGLYHDFGDLYRSKDYSLEYTGYWQRGLHHGQGTKYYSYGIYTGNWGEGKEDGFGTIRYHSTGMTFKGHFKEGLKHGKGQWFYYTGKVLYEVEYENDQGITSDGKRIDNQGHILASQVSEQQKLS